MKQEIANCIMEHGNGDCEIYEGYSGRGMFGKTTYGITCDSISSFISSCINAAIQEPEIMGDFTDEPFNIDSLGLDVIVY